MKKIYLLSQEENSGYDTYDSMVIIADSEKEAILLSYVQAYMLFNSEKIKLSKWFDLKDFKERYTKLDSPFQGYDLVESNGWGSWAMEEHITVTEIGVANVGADSGVVCASFNAG